jgi:hypothetical protein
MQNTARRPKITVSGDGAGIVSHAGALLLAETARTSGLQAGLSAGLGRWRACRAVHDPGKIVTDLAVAVALGGDLLADIGVLRAEAALFGPVASDPVVSRLITRLAADAPAALAAIGTARAAARDRAWQLAGAAAPGADGGLIPVDIDATIVTAHSDKQQAAPTWKKTYGFHPLTVFADHGSEGSGEPLAIMLRPGNAGSNTAADHIAATRLALAQLPKAMRRRILIRADSGGCTHEFLAWLARPGRRLHYSVGFTMTDEICDAVSKIPPRAWTPAYDGDGQVRDGAWVAELSGLLDLTSWPKGNAGHRPQGKTAPRRAAAVHRPRRAPVHLLRHLGPDRAARRPRAAAPPPGTVRRPDPQCQGHRAAEPAPARLRPEPDLVPDRRPRLRPAGLDPDARSHRPGPPLGTKTTATADLQLRRADRPRQPPPPAAHGCRVALDPRHHRRHRPAAGPGTRLTSPRHPCDQEGETQGLVEPRTRRDSRAASHAQQLKTASQPTAQANKPRSRKIEARVGRRFVVGALRVISSAVLVDNPSEGILDGWPRREADDP